MKVQQPIGEQKDYPELILLDTSNQSRRREQPALPNFCMP
jgi:hypothetical protein